jgi:hypothetical protein
MAGLRAGEGEPERGRSPLIHDPPTLLGILTRGADRAG